MVCTIIEPGDHFLLTTFLALDTAAGIYYNYCEFLVP